MYGVTRVCVRFRYISRYRVKTLKQGFIGYLDLKTIDSRMCLHVKDNEQIRLIFCSDDSSVVNYLSSVRSSSTQPINLESSQKGTFVLTDPKGRLDVFG